jgi:hypothetical protein
LLSVQKKSFVRLAVVVALMEEKEDLRLTDITDSCCVEEPQKVIFLLAKSDAIDCAVLSVSALTTCAEKR